MTRITFEGKAILAPMVRISSLPMRALCLEYGAGICWTLICVDIVFGPEIVDKKIIASRRLLNTALGTIDYVDANDRLVFRTHSSEKDRLVFQIGSADPDLALQAANVVSDDVAGIDLNCGCPKHFSVHAGMGAALLRTPDRLTAILGKLVRESGLPVSAKIRMLPSMEETAELARRIIATGIHALTIHCRTPDERPQHPAQHARLRDVISSISPIIPVIINGDIWTRAEGAAAMCFTGASGFMMARAAQWNPSCFSTSPADLLVVCRKYLHHALSFAAPFNSTKYAIQQIWLGEQARHQQAKTKEPMKLGRPSQPDRPDRLLLVRIQRARTMSEMCAIFGVDAGSEWPSTDTLDDASSEGEEAVVGALVQ